MKTWGLVVLSLVVLGCATGSDRPAPKSVAQPSEKQVEKAVAQYNEGVTQEKEKIICTRESIVGSHFTKRVCRTVAEMEQEREAARRSIDDTYTSQESTVGGQ